MAKGIKEHGGCPLHWVDNSGSQPRHLLQAAALYLMVVAALWCVPTRLYDRISETGQTVVLTLVDTAAAELQNLAEPKLSTEFRSKSSLKNSTLLTSSSSSAQFEESPNVSSITQIPPPLIVDEATERPNNTNILDEENAFLVHKSQDISEEVPEVVVIVRAEQKVTTDGSDLKLEDDSGHILTEDVHKVEDAFTTAAVLNDSAARAQLVGGTGDDAAAVIFDGLVTSGPTNSHEDIPSFSEWAQKRLEEAEKKKTHPNVSVQTPGGPGRGVGGMKIRSKNYASPDCGAKIVAVNPEARSARSVLVTTRDEYMLNTCTSRIWFVVELCEAIQARKIELANFELFSSSPKDFAVHVSDRFPTRDWSPVGQFTAKDLKDTQSFGLQPHLFGKFIKVEVHSHYGSEHFCPISLFRAYGTSEFEVLETETENQIPRETSLDAEDDEDSDEEEPLDAENGDPPRNLFGSARDAVLSIVKKAAEVLVKSSDMTGNNITEIQQSIDEGTILEHSYESCTTPRYTILCDNCSDHKFARVFQLVSCRNRQLDELLKFDFINRTLRQGRLCAMYGVRTESSWGKKKMNETKDDNESRPGDLQATFLTSVFKPEYIVALCNVLATKERKVVMNTSYEIPSNSSEENAREDLLTTKMTENGDDVSGTFQQISATCILDSNSAACKSSSSMESKRRVVELQNEETEGVTTAFIEAPSSTDSLASQNKLTKTLSKEDLKRDTLVPIVEPSKESTVEAMSVEVLTTVPLALNTVTPTIKTAEELPVHSISVETASQTIGSVPVVNLDNQETGDNVAANMDTLDNWQNKIEKSEQVEQDGKQTGKPDISEQEAKLSSQDHLSFDTLLSDFKDFEGDGVNIPNGLAASAPSMAQATTTTTPQKESVFLRLSNRIKALERNMSLSGQYLEELSRRYKKQVEEMQRSLERAVSAMGEESRKGEEREIKRLDEIAALREEIAILSKSVDNLMYDRDSWQSRFSAIAQHALLICLELILAILIISYSRRTGEFEEDGKQKSISERKTVRRKSAENFSSHAKKTRKRRPSEIASHITGTYCELMIENCPQETKKERKKKRKKEVIMQASKAAINSDTKREVIRYKSVLDVIPGGTNLPSRRASSSDTPKSSDVQDQAYRRPESAPETTVGWFDDQVVKKQVQVPLGDKEFDSEKGSNLSRQMDELSESNSSSGTVGSPVDSLSTERSVELLQQSSFKGGGILKSAKLSSPSFMKSALSSRKKRALSSNDKKWEWSGDTGRFREGSSKGTLFSLKTLSETVGSPNGNTANGLMEESDESRSSSTTPTCEKKEKRSTGLKKMGRCRPR
ncbi:hypothetical protein KM043_016946 [Ampulex compressa]|nr:hypothetical protein KM043_016946 [Ampulex compressa]